MDASDDEQSSARDIRRIELFSDAVLAIVITLLTLELKPPQVTPGHLMQGLLDEWPAYLAYATSFLNLAVIWLAHRAAFTRIRATSLVLSWINLAILFSAALFPFSTAVLSRFLKDGNHDDIRTAVALYALVGVLLLTNWLVFYLYALRHPELIHQGGETYLRRQRDTTLVGIGLFAVAGMAGYISPWIALAIFIGLPLFYGISTPRQPNRRPRQ